jgi:glycosyltransferase involved in cell wall biosynthesis
MKVVHLCYLPLPPDHPNYGRVPRHPGRWVLDLALAQKKHTSIRPELIVQVPGSGRDFSTDIEGIPVHYLATPARFRATTLFYFDAKIICRKIRALAPDLVHGHGLEDAHGLAAQRSGLPYVITAQGLHFLINRRVRPSLVSRERVVEFMEWRCLRKARDVIAKSRYVRDALAAKFPRLRLHEIPNTFDPRLLEIAEEKSSNVIAFVGTISPWKGLDLVCDALEIVRSRNPDVTLWVFGDRPNGASDYESGIKERLRSILGPRVVFHGKLASLEVARWVARAAALVAPSREEMFGNQLIEALLVGTDGVVTENTAMAENVRRFGGGRIVPQEDSKALAEALLEAVENPGAKHMTEVQNRIMAYMGPQVVGPRHEALYKALLMNRPT